MGYLPGMSSLRTACFLITCLVSLAGCGPAQSRIKVIPGEASAESTTTRTKLSMETPAAPPPVPLPSVATYRLRVTLPDAPALPHTMPVKDPVDAKPTDPTPQ